MPDSELCVVFANLLENAAEACGRMTDGRRFVSLRAGLREGVLTIVMDNSYDGSVREEEGQFFSSKRSDFGVGLASVRAVALKFGGDAHFTYDGAVFSSSVYLNL